MIWSITVISLASCVTSSHCCVEMLNTVCVRQGAYLKTRQISRNWWKIPSIKGKNCQILYHSAPCKASKPHSNPPGATGKVAETFQTCSSCATTYHPKNTGSAPFAHFYRNILNCLVIVLKLKEWQSVVVKVNVIVNYFGRNQWLAMQNDKTAIFFFQQLSPKREWSALMARFSDSVQTIFVV